jgi:hypothetical protein
MTRINRTKPVLSTSTKCVNISEILFRYLVPELSMQKNFLKKFKKMIFVRFIRVIKVK